MSAPDFDPVDEAIALLIDRRELIASDLPEDQARAGPYHAALGALFRAEREQVLAETARIRDPSPPNRLQRRIHEGPRAPTTTTEGTQR
jgi:hypothetical protein